MQNLLPIFISMVLFSIGCTNKSKVNSNTSAQVISQSDREIYVTIDAAKDQIVVLPFAETGLQDGTIYFPLGSFASNVTLRISLEDDLIPELSMGDAFNLNRPVKFHHSLPAVGIEQIAPLEPIKPKQPFQISLKWEFAQEGTFTSQLSLEEMDHQVRHINWRPIGENQIESGIVRLESQNLGIFQPIATDYELTEAIEGSTGTGTWWGYEINLFSSSLRPSEASNPFYYLLFDKDGEIEALQTNGNDVSPLPGLSFGIFATEEPGIYDSSDDKSLRPWLWSFDSRHGAMFQSSANYNLLKVKILQRFLGEFEFPPANPLSPESLVGRYRGQAVNYSLEEDAPLIKKLEDQDDIEITFDGSQLVLSGRLANESNSTVSFTWPPEDPIAAKLGIFQGNLTTADGEKLIRLAFSLDQKAISYVICESTDPLVCGNGGGEGSMDPYQFRYGLLTKFNEPQ